MGTRTINIPLTDQFSVEELKFIHDVVAAQGVQYGNPNAAYLARIGTSVIQKIKARVEAAENAETLAKDVDQN